MTLRELIDRLTSAGRYVSSADIPVKLNGQSINIKRVVIESEQTDDGTIKSLYANLLTTDLL